MRQQQQQNFLIFQPPTLAYSQLHQPRLDRRALKPDLAMSLPAPFFQLVTPRFQPLQPALRNQFLPNPRLTDYSLLLVQPCMESSRSLVPINSNQSTPL